MIPFFPHVLLPNGRCREHGGGSGKTQCRAVRIAESAAWSAVERRGITNADPIDDHATQSIFTIQSRLLADGLAAFGLETPAK